MKKLEYGGTPRSIIDINKKFIRDFYAHGVEDGSISEDKLNEWTAIVKKAYENNPNEPMKAFAEYRKKFAKLHFPHLILNDLEDIEFFEALRNNLKKPEQENKE